MDKVKPYMFWIVCGVLLLIELIVIGSGMFWPGIGEGRKPGWMDDPPSKETKSWPKGMKTKVKNVQTELKGMKEPKDVAAMFGDLYDGGGKVGKGKVKQGQRTATLGGIKLLEAKAENLRARDGYTREVDPSDRKDIEAFLSEYLVQQDWTGQLKSKINDYEEKAARVEERLVTRSGVLEETISNKSEAGSWYTDYRKTTSAYLEKIISGGLIDASEAELGNLDNARGLRDRFALDARERGYPGEGSKERAELRDHFNLSRAIMLPLLEAEGTVLADQHFVELREAGRLEAETPPRPDETPGLSRVKVVRLKVEGAEQKDKLKVWRVQIVMRGTPAALLEAMRVIDGLEAPIVVRLGSAWKALDPRDNKEVDVADGHMELTAKLGVCDFRAMSR